MNHFSLKLVDRYILKQLLDYFLLGMVVFTLVAFFSDTLLKFIREVQKYGIPFSTLLTLVGLQLPRSVALVIPPSCFFAVLMVFSQLNNHFEVVAMRMNGISLWRLMTPALVLGVFCAGLAYTLNDYVVPWCGQRTADMKNEVIRSGNLPPNGNSFMFRTFDDQHNLVQMIYVSHYEGHKLGDSTILDLSKPNMMQVVQSRSGRWDQRSGWKLQNANVYLVSKDANHSSAGHSETFWVRGLVNDKKAEEKRLEEQAQKTAGTHVKTDQMSFMQMLAAIQKREAQNIKVARANYLGMWSKITWPLGCVAIVLSAVPLALAPPRQGSKREFILALIVLFLFYQLNATFQSIGRIFYYDFGGLLSLPTYLAIISWFPLLVISAIGILLVRRKSIVL